MLVRNGSFPAPAVLPQHVWIAQDTGQALPQPRQPQRAADRCIYVLFFKQETCSRHLFCTYCEVEHCSRHQLCKTTRWPLRSPIHFPQKVGPPALVSLAPSLSLLPWEASQEDWAGCLWPGCCIDCALPIAHVRICDFCSVICSSRRGPA